jgi:hypothetical protein
MFDSPELVNQVAGERQDPAGAFFCMVSESSAAIIQEYGSLAFSLLILASCNARVLSSGRLMARRSAGSLAKLSGASERAVRTALQKLEAGGVIQRRISGGNVSWIVIETGQGIERFDSARRRERPAAAPVVDNPAPSAGTGEESAGGGLQNLQGAYKRDPDKQINKNNYVPSGNYQQGKASRIDTKVSGRKKERQRIEPENQVDPETWNAFRENFLSAVEGKLSVPDGIIQNSIEQRLQLPRQTRDTLR